MQSPGTQAPPQPLASDRPIPPSPLERKVGAVLPLLRPKRGKWFAGVAQGLALHLGMNVLWVRLAFVVMTFCYGIGALVYVVLWILIPAGDPYAEARRLASENVWTSSRANPTPTAYGHVLYGSSQAAASAQPLAKPLTHPTAGSSSFTGTNRTTGSAHRTAQQYSAPNWNDSSLKSSLSSIIQQAPKPALAALAGLICIGLALLFSSSHFNLGLALPGFIAVIGIIVAWFRIGSDRGSLGMMICGITLIFVAYAFLITYNAWHSGEVSWWHSLIGGLGLLICVAVAIIPWITHLIRANANERAQKEREEERADMAAHLHDGVLQTLALIQLNASDPHQVVTLARSQERELRGWLYQERTTSDRSVNAGIEQIAAEIEQTHGTPIDVVTVGDAEPSTQTDAILAATTQALVNAVTHGAEPISVYAEVDNNNIDVFVRDHGAGFDADLDHLPEGRLGIRESIVGRLTRRGGHVDIISRPNWGTEVRMSVPLTTNSSANSANSSSTFSSAHSSSTHSSSAHAAASGSASGSTSSPTDANVSSHERTSR